MATPIYKIPEASTSILSFSLLNIILRHYEQSSNKIVQGIENSPPPNPNDGAAFLVADSGTTGVFVGQENNIAFSIQGAFYFIEMNADTSGTTIYDVTNDVYYYWTGTAFVERVKEAYNYLNASVSTTFDISSFVHLETTAASLTLTASYLPYGTTRIFNVGSNTFDVEVGVNLETIAPGDNLTFLINKDGDVFTIG